MDLALYDPAGGYYRSEEARPGRAGDFLTAPETHPIFGLTLARFVDDVWQGVGRPDPFVVREHGAGDGALAIAILSGLRASRSGLAESSATHRSRWTRAESRPSSTTCPIPASALHPAADDGPFTGLVLANEVADALPVHRVVQRGTELLEVRVGLDGDRFVDLETAPSTPDLFVRLAAEGITLADGQRGEICLAVEAGSPRRRPASTVASPCSSITAIPPPSSTTRSAGATGRCGHMSATRSTTTHTRTSAGRT